MECNYVVFKRELESREPHVSPTFYQIIIICRLLFYIFTMLTLLKVVNGCKKHTKSDKS